MAVEAAIGSAVVVSSLLVAANVVNGFSQTAYDLLRIGGLALVIVVVLCVVVWLVGMGLQQIRR